ncbi:hypothetical protein B0H13DRAFT_2416382, partial [Mycena leptocephala]
APWIQCAPELISLLLCGPQSSRATFASSSPPPGPTYAVLSKTRGHCVVSHACGHRRKVQPEGYRRILRQRTVQRAWAEVERQGLPEASRKSEGDFGWAHSRGVYQHIGGRMTPSDRMSVLSHPKETSAADLEAEGYPDSDCEGFFS